MTVTEAESVAHSLVSQISSPSFARADDSSAIESLRQIKNSILGHDQQKLLYVGFGVVEPLIQVLERKDGTFSVGVRTETVTILGSLLYGGTNFVPDAQILRFLPYLVDGLNPSTTAPTLLLASLRTLNVIFSLPTSPKTAELVESLHTRDFGTSLSSLLRNTQISHQIVILASSLVAQTCPPCDPKWQDDLIEMGVLSGLVMRLAMLIKCVEKSKIGKGAGLLRIDTSTFDRSILSKSSSMVSLATNQIVENFVSALPPNEGPLAVPQAQSTLRVSAIFQAIAVIVRGDKLRCSECLFAGWITNILGEECPPEKAPLAPVWKDTKPSGDLLDTRTPAPARNYAYHGQEFPPLSPTTERAPQRRSGSISGPSHFVTASQYADNETDIPDEPQFNPLQFTGESESDPESPVVPWLISYIRDERDLNNRLMAVNLLTEFVRAGCVSKGRIKTIGCLVVPILVRWLDDVDNTTGALWDACTRSEHSLETMKIRYRAPGILATLVADNVDLQKAAVEAHAIKKLTFLLKRSFEDCESDRGEVQLINMSFTVGDEFRKEQIKDHHLKLREASLKALAAIALFDDDYRRQVIDSGAMEYIRYSLIPTPVEGDQRTDSILGDVTTFAVKAKTFTLPPAKKLPTAALSGNPEAVLVAATATIRSLSRSVSILSTSLIDAQVCQPLCQLLLYPSLRVKIAATAAICNLAMSFSPMRNTLIDTGIIDVMCKFVKNLDGKQFDENHEDLRLNALWTLKHLVSDITGPIKRTVLNGIGAAWIVEFINRDVGVPPRGTSFLEDVRMEGEDRIGESDAYYEQFFGTPPTFAVKALRSHDIPFSETVLQRLSVKWQPQDGSMMARIAMVNLQEQALDFIRNLVVQPASSMMIDMLLSANPNFFSVFTKKLASKPEPQTVHAIIFILVNIAASNQDHRKKLIEQKILFKELNKFFKSSIDQVRSGLTWLAINLTWKDDDTDGDDVRDRVQKLREMGFIDELERLSARGLENEAAGVFSASGSVSGDVLADGAGSASTASVGRISLDVRERCKQALKQIQIHS